MGFSFVCSIDIHILEERGEIVKGAAFLRNAWSPVRYLTPPTHDAMIDMYDLKTHITQQAAPPRDKRRARGCHHAD